MRNENGKKIVRVKRVRAVVHFLHECRDRRRHRRGVADRRPGRRRRQGGGCGAATVCNAPPARPVLYTVGVRRRIPAVGNNTDDDE